MKSTGTPRRSTAERVSDFLERLVAERDVWLSTSHPDHGPHQVPLWFLWDGQAVWMCTSATSPTVRNIRVEPRVHLSLPDTFDVVLIRGEAECFPDHEVPGAAADAYVEKFGWDTRTEEGDFVYVRVTPNSARAWRGEPELRGRVIMREGIWLSY
ncbi:pyridoxamine 5'-phosphate oxidase family protein [Streptomyces sp. J2-1]|uniref:pyridoxamine 5'-phosphate oxidase family protein n=1 Tax=Streptomyces corallincola TaxID=2851888 RepID=UPI001C393FF4|nr:pyridoxamine 5'-phosphate oxidase family protein [Streptomyces corallincola]MBV2358087.1 pyridoxamine 5'-phosphate oxidase family protein [Streptomyces corallincola]